ncbi:MAG: N-formylglutamate amidohydrolase [Rhodobacterales bacterium]|nr:N-formylglutamate amidohydrolase [Rhodobacterales bacterium]
MPKAAYHLINPHKRTTSVVFASPHSGRDYPWSFMRQTVLDAHVIRSSEDAFVDHLFEEASKVGAPFLKAGAPRAFLDLNRSSEELDPALINGARKQSQNPRVASGLGVIPRVVSNGRVIYRNKLPMSEAKRRIENYWRPYHEVLQRILDDAHTLFGEAILIDCHSMPHEAVDVIARSGAPRPDVVLGDRFGAAASSGIVDRVEQAFVNAGLTVSRNAPFAGAYITQHYGRPSRNQHAIQIEIDRAIYMNEQLVRPNNNFKAFRHLMKTVIGEIAQIGRVERSLAAE